jgi:hypothetical protein
LQIIKNNKQAYWDNTKVAQHKHQIQLIIKKRGTMKNKRLKWITGFLLIVVTLNAQNSNNVVTTGPGSYKVLIDEYDTIKIPFKMHNRKPLMELEINGKKATLMIDNGVLWDQVWLFGSSLVEELQLKPIDGNSTQLYNSENLTIKFDDIIFYEQPVLVSPPTAGFARMFPGADGQLCNTFFKHFIVEFDFIENEIILHDPRKFKYNGKGCILDMQLSESGMYSVPFKITTKDGKVYKDRADIDLGGIYPFKVALNTIHNLQVPSDAKERPAFGGTEYFAKIDNMTIGDYTFEQPTVAFGDEKTARVHPKNIGMIGLPLFMKFNIIFDYFNNRIYVEPNENFDKQF